MYRVFLYFKRGTAINILYHCYRIITCITFIIIDASDMELLVNDSVLTTSLEAVTSNKATTVDHNISSQKMENIGKEPVIRLGIEHKLMIVFSLLLMSVLIAYLIVTFYEYSMSYETYEHSHIVYYSEGSIVNFRL